MQYKYNEIEKKTSFVIKAKEDDENERLRTKIKNNDRKLMEKWRLNISSPPKHVYYYTTITTTTLDMAQ